MNSYRRLLWVLGGLALLMTTVPTSLRVVGHSSYGELYPLSRWSMFNKVHTTRADFGLRLLSLKGQALNPAPYFERSSFSTANSIVAYQAIQTLGRLLQDQTSNVQAARSVIERQYLESQTATYEIVAREYDPIDVWGGRPFAFEKALARFEVGATDFWRTTETLRRRMRDDN